ncbi:MAG: hypothetical protein HZC41_10960 [Chloroflexi bacterium]|nr:hypothetical protein [Chloroflexota bacterium]
MTQDFSLGRLESGAAVRFFHHDGWGIEIVQPRGATLRQAKPVMVQHYRSEDDITHWAAAYDAVEAAGDTVTASASVSLSPEARCTVSDQWQLADSQLCLTRSVRIEGQAEGGFLTAILLDIERPLTWLDVDAFAPGMIYGREGRINPRAIGSRENYADGVRHVIIREDRLPAPMFGLHFNGGSTVSLLNPAPDARTVAEEGDILQPITRVDTRLRFGALGCVERDQALSIGYWFPGTEGEITYRGREFPFGQLRHWRRAYHPIQDGETQQYQLIIRLGSTASFADYCRETWRWAWNVHQPQVCVQDLEMVRRSSAQLLYDLTHRASNGMTGPYIWVEATPTARGLIQYLFSHISTIGFVGRGPDVGYHLLREAARPDTPDDKRQQFYERGAAVLDSYASIPMNPPQAEGFNLMTGALHTSKFVEGGADTLYLRSLSEGGKFALRAWRFEQREGREHPRWREWGLQIADFLLAHQQPDGGVPRIYEAKTGKVYKDSPRSTYNAIALWVLTYQVTGEQKYLDAALRAGNFCWGDGHQQWCFVGGTIDNPDVIDKEAGTLSLEAYMALYEQTRDTLWLERARQAADFAETWIYCWNVPMPDDADNAELHWKKGVPTIGLQLIATGHSLVDDYMAFDVASYAKLYAYTRDEHYAHVARILLHNTKIMTCLPDHPYDLPQYGFQQEHWGIAPSRGKGMHRGWLPWVTCSNLQGILELQDFDADLYRQMAGG